MKSWAATLALGLSVWATSLAGPAIAHHSHELVHQEPPFANEGESLVLVLTVVSHCGAGVVYCYDVVTSIRYAVDGQVQTEHVILPPSGGAAIFEVPGEHVHEPAFRYSFGTDQLACGLAGSGCHNGGAASPLYEVPVEQP